MSTRFDEADRALALAGLFQASALVADVAHGRPLDGPAFRCVLESLFVTDPDRVADVYGGPGGVRLGLLLVRDGLGRERPQAQSEVLRYALAIVQTERRFTRRADLQQLLRTRLARIAEQRAHFDTEHATIIGALASAYQDTLSTLRQRIQVVGNAAALQDERNAERIRAILLAGVRSALLWHQTGGRRWRLLLAPAPTRNAAQALLQRLT